MNVKYITRHTNILEYCELRGITIQRGNMLKCIAHEESNPSMKLYPETNSFYCFSCQASGDIIKFVQYYEDVDFNNACWILISVFNLDKLQAAVCQVSLWSPKKEVHQEQSICGEVPGYQDYKHVYGYFLDSLTLTANGEQYLRTVRGFDESTIERAKVLSVDDPSVTLELLQRDFSEEVLYASGLVFYTHETDALRLFCMHPSVIIPFYDKDGYPVYFSSRSYSGKHFSKLAGVPQVPYVFRWGYKEYYVFESVFDLLAFYELTGKDNLVSLNGLSGTNSLKNYLPSCKFEYCLDNDTAGFRKLQNLGVTESAYSVTNMCKSLNISSFGIKDYNDILKKIRGNL